ncbi:hypothetical protein A7985_00390 [Pseudoalteromonas luteoviolacea]|uniref:Uncharacterized protein n=2 Tax=Pseudoalteromonas luteoviolacea TaxID=43657 RepID=A0A1C0TT13_9GAMM|nr:hypothetical protein A7985_00390 [Pseudoalteromonas luteoviolacea]
MSNGFIEDAIMNTTNELKFTITQQVVERPVFQNGLPTPGGEEELTIHLEDGNVKNNFVETPIIIQPTDAGEYKLLFTFDEHTHLSFSESTPIFDLIINPLMNFSYKLLNNNKTCELTISRKVTESKEDARASFNFFARPTTLANNMALDTFSFAIDPIIVVRRPK